MTTDEALFPKKTTWPAAALGWCGLLTLPFCLWSLRRFQFNVANYTTQAIPNLPWATSLVFLVVCFAFVLVLVCIRSRVTGFGHVASLIGIACLPLAICIPVAAFTLSVECVPFVTSYLLIAAAGWTGYRAGSILMNGNPSTRFHGLGFAAILAMVFVLTIVHTKIQRNYYDHFLLGHADIGHYLEEMKNCLAGRGLRSDSFDFVRHGWHFVPLFYVVVPLFWLWPTETFWMVFGAFTMHATSLVAYVFAKRVTGSTICALGWGFAWLLLPSVSRMVYSNTYGFQWTCVAIPLIALMIYFWYVGRAWLSACMALLVLLTQETNAVSVFGWGLFLALFTKRRLHGAAAGLAAIVYLALCLIWIIPYFSHGVEFQRFDLFGTLGPSIVDVAQSPFKQPAEFFSRFGRVEVLYYLGMLVIPLAGLPLRGWKLAAGAIPGLALILLLDNKEFLSVKFWHLSAILPFLFFAGLASLDTPNRRREGEVAKAQVDSNHHEHFARALAVLFAALFAHCFFAFSPVSRPYAAYAADPVMQRPDPRLATVAQLRREISRAHSIVATERLAAHFWDYRRIYSGRIRPVDYVIIDRSDAWDRSGLPQSVDKVRTDPHYEQQDEYGSIVVFRRRDEAPPGNRRVNWARIGEQRGPTEWVLGFLLLRIYTIVVL